MPRHARAAQRQGRAGYGGVRTGSEEEEEERGERASARKGQVASRGLVGAAAGQVAAR